MSFDGDVFQIAFMVDLQSYKRNKENELACQQVANQIRLSALKLLTHFCQVFSQTKTSSHNLRWGYTFYNSCSLASPNVRSDFKEFNLKNFDVFESDVEERLENERMMEEGSISKGVRCRSEATKYGLMDLSNDFPWGRPEIMSPVRPSRHKKAQPKAQGWKNISFVFSHCPNTEEDIGSFMYGPVGKQFEEDVANSSNIKAKDVLNRITTPPLLREICDGKRIRIFLVDLTEKVDVTWNVSSLTQPHSSPGLQLFNDVLQEFSGRVIPLGAILQLGSPTQCQIVPNLRTVDDRTCAANEKVAVPHLDALVPFSSVSDHMIGNANVTTANAVHDGKAGTGLVFLTEKGKQVCYLDTQSLLNQGETLNHRLNGQLKSGKDAKVSTVVLAVSGTLQRGALPLEYLSNTDVYLCTQSKKYSKEALFYSILAEISKQNLALVVDFTSLVRNTCWKAILQPLTSVSATLTVIKPDHILFVEKLLTSKLIAESKHEGLQSFLDRTVNHLLEGVSIRQVHQAMPSDLESVVSNEHSDTKMLSSILEPWYLQGCRQATMQSVVESLKDGSLGPGSEELQTIRKLQKLYRCASNPDPTRANPKKVEKQQEEKKEEGKGGAPKLLKNEKDTSIRARTMVEKGRKIMEEKQKSDNSPSKEEKKEKIKPARIEIDRSLVEGKDFKDDTELVAHLQENYEKVLAGKFQPVLYAQMAFVIVNHYYKEGGKADPKESTLSLMNSMLMVDTRTLKEKFNASSVEKADQVTEFQVQIALHMEQESFRAEGQEVESVDDTRIKEVVKMINSMTVASDDSSIQKRFLNEVLLEHYAPTIPLTMANLYEELMLQPPEFLPQLFSPSSQSDDEKQVRSVSSARSLSSVRSELLFSEDSSDPWSVRTRSRKVSRYSSVSDMASNKQIMMPVAQKSRRRRSGKRSKKEKLPRAASSSDIPIMVAETVEKKKETETEDDSADVKKVRRNLFMGGLSAGSERLLERRQSIAVMENVAHVRESPPKKKVLKTRTVAETPEHKQVGKSLRNSEKMEKLARRMSMKSEVMVVEESPEKPMRGAAVRKSPRRMSIAPALTRKRSFYSDHPSKKSRNVEKYRTVTREFRSPDKVVKEHAKSILFSQFGSPSPGKKISGSPKVTPRRSLRLFSPEKDEIRPEILPPKLTPHRTSGVKKRLLGVMQESPKKTPVKSPRRLTSPTRYARDESVSTPKKSPSSTLVVPDSCLKTPQRVIWSEPIEMGPHTPCKTPDRPESILSGGKKTPKRRGLEMHAAPYFTRTRTPKKDTSESVDELRRSNGRRDLFGLKSAQDQSSQPITPGKTVVFESKFSTPQKKVVEMSSLLSPRTPRSILKSKTGSFSSPVADGRSPVRFAKRLCLESLGSDIQTPTLNGAENSPQKPLAFCVEDVNIKDKLIRTPVGVKSKQKSPTTPGLFGDDWGKTTPDKFETINLDGILPLLGNSPIVMKTNHLSFGDVTPERMLAKPADVTPQSNPLKKTPDSFDKWKRKKRRKSVQQSPTGEQLKLEAESAEPPEESRSPKLNRKVRKHSRVSSPKGLDGVTVIEYADQKCSAAQERVASPDTESVDSVLLLTPSFKSARNSLSLKDTEELMDTTKDNNSYSKNYEKADSVSGKRVQQQESPIVRADDLSPECLFTPQRFTRGLSKETGLTPELFTDMSTKSPRKRLAIGSVGAYDKVKGSGKRKRLGEVLKTGDLPAGLACPWQGALEARNGGKGKPELVGTPTKRRRVLRGDGQSVGFPSYEESPVSQMQSISSQVSCPDYFSSENEDVFLSNGQEQFRYIDETTCGFSSDTSFTKKSQGTPSGYLRHSLSLSGVPSGLSNSIKTSHTHGASNHSEDSNGRRELRSTLLHQTHKPSSAQGISNHSEESNSRQGLRSSQLSRCSSGSMLLGGSNLSQQDEESLEALSVMSENVQSPRKSLFHHQKLVAESNVPVSPSHHRVEALRKLNRLPRSPTHSNPSPQMEEAGFPHYSVAEQSDSEKESPKSTASVPKKYSPNITARALSHLLQSPILKLHENLDFDLCEKTDTAVRSQPKENCAQPETKRSSRRSLYRTQTKSAI
ncbi:treslin-like [Lineus longissimus]|uniref:treslin-like n=1 Tax=Lineus longissimus TaxID=88925 RepID=UPI002B4F57A5